MVSALPFTALPFTALPFTALSFTALPSTALPSTFGVPRVLVLSLLSLTDKHSHLFPRSSAALGDTRPSSLLRAV